MSTNYYNPLAVIDTSALSEKGQQQVNDFIEYLRPRYDTIKNGEVTKEEVAKHYLEMESSYTDGAKARITTLTEGLGISKGYLSKIKNAGKLLDSYSYDKCVSNWIEEHPVSCQYLMSRVGHTELKKKFDTGSHFSKRELESINKASKEVEHIQPVSDKVKTEFELKQERFQEMVDSDEFPLIRDKQTAEVWSVGSRKTILAAAAQVLLNYKYRDEDLAKIIDIVNQLSESAKTKTYYTPRRLSEV